MLRCVRGLLRSAVQGHQQEFQFAHSAEREAAAAMFRALVDGDPAADLAHRAGIRLASGYAVVALGLGAHSTESVGDAVGRRLGGRRKVARINEQLSATFGTDMLSELGPDEGLVLLPAGSDGDGEGELAELRAGVPRLQQAADVVITAGFAHAAQLECVPSAVTRAQKLLRLAMRPGQVATLDEYLFEYQLCHDSDAVPQLRAMTARMGQERDLVTTLTAYFSNDFNRRETARQLHVHPNTVDNRIARIATLTGANPRTARGLLLLGAALGIAPESSGAEH